MHKYNRNFLPYYQYNIILMHLSLPIWVKEGFLTMRLNCVDIDFLVQKIPHPYLHRNISKATQETYTAIQLVVGLTAQMFSRCPIAMST